MLPIVTANLTQNEPSLKVQPGRNSGWHFGCYKQPVAEEKPQKIERVIHVAVQWCGASLVLSAVLLSVAFFLNPVVALAAPGMMLALIGFFLGLVPLVSALKAQRRDIAAGFAAVPLSALLFAGNGHTLFARHDRPHPAGYACINNLKQLDGAKATWALEFHKTTNHIPTDSDLFGSTAYIRVKPECPRGGIYRIGTVGEKSLCSIPGHTL